MSASHLHGLVEAQVMVKKYCEDVLRIISALACQVKGQGDSASEALLNSYKAQVESLGWYTEDQSSDLTQSALYQHLQVLAKLVLDVTFVEENDLIQDDFSGSSSFTQITNIIETLQSVEDLVKQVATDQSVKDVLGPEMLECLYWRKGALLYMYCHTLNSQDSPGSWPSHYHQCLEEGVQHLISMLSARSCPSWLTRETQPCRENRDLQSDPDTAADLDGPSLEPDPLLDKGIRSDTHVLALIYCAEMCYWHTQLIKCPNASTHVCLPTSDDSSSTTGGSGTRLRGQSSHISLNPPDQELLGTCVQQNNVKSFISSSGSEESLTNSERIIINKENPRARVAKCGIDVVRIGRLCVENYISVVRGPLHMGGWTTSRAEHILEFFMSL